ncbi:hypothetical protein Hanom_Chr04g00296521 [Helianthus anomalus]
MNSLIRIPIRQKPPSINFKHTNPRFRFRSSQIQFDNHNINSKTRVTKTQTLTSNKSLSFSRFRTNRNQSARINRSETCRTLITAYLSVLN